MTNISNIYQRFIFSKLTQKLTGDNLDYSDQILCYHSVSDDQWQYSVNPQDFEKQLLWLKEHFEVLSLHDYLKKSHTSRPKVALTFDDGYASVFENAFPIMSKLNMVGTVFLCNDVSKLGLKNDDKNILNERMITTLINAGWEVGYHSRSHEDLSTLKSDEMLNHEIDPVDTKINSTMTKPRYFAYPFGHYNKYAERFVKEHFNYGFTTNPLLENMTNSSSISRILVERVHSDLNIFAVLTSNQGRKRYQGYTTFLKAKSDIVTSLINFIKQKPSSTRIYYPPQIDDITLEEPFHPEDPSDSYYFGLYKSKSNNYFVKFWSAKRVNIRFKWLQNEAKFYEIYWRTFTQASLSDNNVVIPQYYGSNFETRPPYLIIEKITGTPISKLSIAKQLVMINDTLNFLSSVFKKISIFDIRRIPNRSPLYWSMLSPIVTLGALLKHPREAHRIIRIALNMVKYSLPALKRRERSLVHRDINEWNILSTQAGKTILIDFQLICLADPLVEVAIIILKYYSQPGSLKKILKTEYIRALLSSPTSHDVLRYYLLLFTIYDYHLNHDSTPEAIRLADDYLKGNISI